MNSFGHHLIKHDLCKRNGVSLTLSLTYRNTACKDVFTEKGLTLILKHHARESFKVAGTNDRRGSWSSWGQWGQCRLPRGSQGFFWGRVVEVTAVFSSVWWCSDNSISSPGQFQGPVSCNPLDKVLLPNKSIKCWKRHRTQQTGAATSESGKRMFPGQRWRRGPCKSKAARQRGTSHLWSRKMVQDAYFQEKKWNP